MLMRAAGQRRKSPGHRGLLKNLNSPAYAGRSREVRSKIRKQASLNIRAEAETLPVPPPDVLAGSEKQYGELKGTGWENAA